MKASIEIALLTLIMISTARKGFPLASFVDPPSGSTIAQFEGAVNATTLTCNITLSDHDGSTQTFTEWFKRNFRGNAALQLINDNSLPEVFSVGGDPLPTDPTRTFRNRLTLLNFTAELDGVTIFCGMGGVGNHEQAVFYLRVYRPPMLRDNVILKVRENGGRIPINISEGLAAFPEPTSQWSKDGQLLDGSRPNRTYNTVTFDNARRSDTGNYTVVATNYVLNSTTEQVGNDTGSFYLDVHYGPILTPGPLRRYVLLNDSLSLVCGTGLGSNPQASVTWMAPDGTVIMDSARYDLENGPEIVRLNLTHTIPSDDGIWKCRVFSESDQYVVSNDRLIRQDSGLIGEVTVDIQLTIIAPPGQPHTLSVKEGDATLFQVCWESPVQSDSHISYYLLRACNLNSSIDSNKVTSTTTISNETFYSVTGLLPGTTYELTVVAVSQGGDVVARSQPSDPIVDTTRVTVPELFCNASISSNKIVTVTWSYIHTGGLPLTNVSVSYTSDNSLRPIPIPLISVDTTLVTIPDLIAGIEYVFNVTAVNSEGLSSTVCDLATPESVSSGNNPDLVVAIAGGVVGGWVVILSLIALIGFGIAAVTLSLRKRDNQIQLGAVYEDPDSLQQYTPKKDIELEECPAYVVKRKSEIKLEECPAYGQANKDEGIKLEECSAYVEKKKNDFKLEDCPAYGQHPVQERPR